MHVIQFVDGSGEILVERLYLSRDKAYVAFDRAVNESPSGGAVEIVMREDGRILRRSPVGAITRVETRETPAATNDLRERTGEEAVDQGRPEPALVPAAIGKAKAKRSGGRS